MSYKPERALTQKKIDEAVNLINSVEMSYKPERALTLCRARISNSHRVRRNELQAREGIDTQPFSTSTSNDLSSGRNELQAREGIDTCHCVSAYP